jgi:predicted transcriptional regulator
MTTSHVNDSDDEDTILMNELRINDERLTKEMFDVVLDPNKMLNVLTKKLQLYNETEAALKESRNKLIVGFMKVAVENRMMITQIKKDLDLKVGELTKQVEKLEEEKKVSEESK